jgi:hypothetical protein
MKAQTSPLELKGEETVLEIDSRQVQIRRRMPSSPSQIESDSRRGLGGPGWRLRSQAVQKKGARAGCNKGVLLDILTKSVMDSYDACMLHVRCMHAYLALDCWAVHSDSYTSAIYKLHIYFPASLATLYRCVVLPAS